MRTCGSPKLSAPQSERQVNPVVEPVEKVCGVSSGELGSGSRRAEIVEARRVFSLLAVKELGYSGAAVARYLGVTNSCVTRAVSAEESPQKEKYI
jgi:hypothetical protein